ncbi:malonate decarboxylase subunit alpha [Staphylococcus ratti]|uniref:Malonate decarboxylase subunit alpha n=1 Tax=Staphylococcus ratti TaxID=2892440 RepID=A0ABY3PD50_9STAP|nr:malonate decarboxylase subunit alpha [Staphylococcus ratti]UEX90247.1 malonate decarboxylase subunit alpha [Staphylococcus ratti]
MKHIKQSEVKNIVQDGDVIGLAALTVSNLPAEVLQLILTQYDETQSPKNLTMMLANDISSGGFTVELDDFVERGMVKRLIMSIMTASPKTANAIKSNAVEAYFLPQGVIATHYRQTNAITPGVLTKIGLNTGVDPKYQGGKANATTTEDLVTRVELKDQTYLHYVLPAVDVAILRGTYADTKGNIYMTHEAHLGESYSVALNAKAHGGKVIVQVKEIVDAGQQNPNDVFIPGALVDFVYVSTDKHFHHQLIQTYYQPELSGERHIATFPEPPLPFTTRKLILRRAAQLLNYGDTVSIGFGINNELTNLLHEEHVEDAVLPLMDTGIFGGFFGSRNYFGMNYNTEARLRHELTWDFIYNGGVSVAYMSFAEVDANGNVNVSFFGNRMNGCGGFIDISQSVQRLVFCGALVAGGKLNIIEGKLEPQETVTTQKFVSEVSHIDFNAAYAKAQNQEVTFVTDRAVFELQDDGLTLTEIAPGLDLEQDVLQHMAFRPKISETLTTIDHTIYNDVWGQLSQSIHNHSNSTH